jgi:hypothetical protein
MLVGSNGDRRPFNPGRNMYNPGHDRGRAYGGYAQGWQCPPYPGYRFSGSRFVHNGRERGDRPAALNQQTMANQRAAVGGDSSHQSAATPHAEPPVPEVFKMQKVGKAKVEEGQFGEGIDKSDKPFCFHCYKPGHGKLYCTAKLLCEIYGNTEHLTGRCPILKQPRLLAHPCGYDVNGLGFYHIPHAPIQVGKTNNTKALVKVKGGELSITQLVAELSRLIPEKWHWQVTQHDKQSFVVPFPSRGDL